MDWKWVSIRSKQWDVYTKSPPLMCGMYLSSLINVTNGSVVVGLMEEADGMVERGGFVVVVVVEMGWREVGDG